MGKSKRFKRRSPNHHATTGDTVMKPADSGKTYTFGDGVVHIGGSVTGRLTNAVLDFETHALKSFPLVNPTAYEERILDSLTNDHELSYEEWSGKHFPRFTTEWAKHFSNETETRFMSLLLGTGPGKRAPIDFAKEWWDQPNADPLGDIIKIFEEQEKMASERFRAMMREALGTASEMYYLDANVLGGLQGLQNKLRDQGVMPTEKPNIPRELAQSTVEQAIYLFLTKLKIAITASADYAKRLQRESPILYAMVNERIKLPTDLEIISDTGEKITP